MRIALLVLAVALVLGGLVGVLVARDPGYVLVAYQDVAVETSLWFAAAAVLVLFLLIQAALLVARRLGSGGGRLKGWQRQRRTRAARDQTVRGLLLVAEGRWAEARKLLENAAPRAEAPLINYLNAARAAHETGDRQGRDALLKAAHESTSGARFAVGLAQAELQRADGQWQRCLATVQQLYRQSPRHPQVLGMLVSCYQHLGDWQAVLELAADLKKHRVMSGPELLSLQVEAWGGRLASAREHPESLWMSVPKELRRVPAVAAEFAQALAAAGRGGEAESVLRSALEHDWNDGLVRLYGALPDADPQRRMVVAEGWLKGHPNDADLLLTLGRISLQNRLWAKAREYLEASLRLRPSAEAQSELGRLCSALGDNERGSALLAQALESVTARQAFPLLPLPERETVSAAPGEARS